MGFHLHSSRTSACCAEAGHSEGSALSAPGIPRIPRPERIPLGIVAIARLALAAGQLLTLLLVVWWQHRHDPHPHPPDGEVVMNRLATDAVLRGVSAHRPSGQEITDWALAAGRGDRAALERFIRATQVTVWRFVAHLSDSGSADDLTQETYLRALGSLRRFRARSSAVTWLLSIARRVVVDQVRAARVRPRQAGVTDWQDAVERSQPVGGPGFDEGVALAGLLDSLDAERREAFVLTQTLGLSYEEAAQVCGCPLGTIRSRVFRARQDLIALLHDTGEARERCSAT